jgi:hypothetical protein
MDDEAFASKADEASRKEEWVGGTAERFESEDRRCTTRAGGDAGHC